MARLRVRVEIAKGRKTILLTKLPKVLREAQAFLEMLAQDTGIPASAWEGSNFGNASLALDASKTSSIEESKREAFNSGFSNVAKNVPDDRIRRVTRVQYANIADSIDPDEVIAFGLYQSDVEIPATWHELTQIEAERIEREAQAAVRAKGGIQGVIHAVFLLADEPHFQIRELSSGALVGCYYKDEMYRKVALALQKKGVVVHVFGVTTTNMVGRKVERMDVERLEVAEQLSAEILDRLFGSSSNVLGGGDLQDFIDDVRGRVQ